MATLFLMIAIDQTRMELREDGVLAFNFVQQTDHNYDVLSSELVDYELMRLNAPANADPQAYIDRFDIIWSTFMSLDQSWIGSLLEREGTLGIMEKGRAFSTEYEDLMSVDVELDLQQLETIRTRARGLAHEVYDIGLQMFQRKSRARDKLVARMQTLAYAFWFMGAMLLLAGMTLYFLLIRALRRASGHADQSRSTQLQLSTALAELTSGDIERKAQNRFIAAASHDLRQPLHALGLYLSALTGHVGTRRGQAILANINRSTEALNEMLGSLLDISKLDAGVVDVEITDFHLDTVFERLHDAFIPEARERELAMDVHLPDLWVRTDRMLLERVLRNLVSNALTYTPSGSVTLSAKQHEGQVRIDVTDTGLGIPLIEQKAIFNEYYQLHNPERDRSKGLGLGLSIVRRLTALLDIRLEIDSSEGKGTRFELTVIPGIEDKHLKNNRIMPENLDSSSLSGLTVLVIDDEPDVRDGMQVLLTQQSCLVIVADSAVAACNELINSELVPDVIVADYRLRDDMTGEDAIEQVREELNVDVPAMIVTGDTSPDRLKDATSSGFRLLHKPVIAEELFAAIVELSREPS